MPEITKGSWAGKILAFLHRRSFWRVVQKIAVISARNVKGICFGGCTAKVYSANRLSIYDGSRGNGVETRLSKFRLSESVWIYVFISETISSVMWWAQTDEFLTRKQ